RMFSGLLKIRDRLMLRRDNAGDSGRKITAITVFEHGSAGHHASIAAGQIGKLWGLGDVRIGDSIGLSQASPEHYFAPPTLETAILPLHPQDKPALHAALAQ